MTYKLHRVVSGTPFADIEGTLEDLKQKIIRNANIYRRNGIQVDVQQDHLLVAHDKNGDTIRMWIEPYPGGRDSDPPLQHPLP